MPKAKIIAMSAPVAVQAAVADGEKKSPASFVATFYTGGALNINGWDLPVVVDLAGLKNGNVLVANLDHDSSKRVGNFAVANDGKTLVANGKATAATAARDEVVQSAADGYEWQASLEVQPAKVETVKAGKTVSVNGQEFEGPLYVTRQGTLKGFAFVSHGADDNTTATIAATAASQKGKTMNADCKKWVKAMLPSLDIDNLTDEEVAAIESQHAGIQPDKTKKVSANPFEARKAETKRRRDIRACADRMIDLRGGDEIAEDELEAIEKMYEHAIASKMDAQEFRNELNESVRLPAGHTVSAPKRHVNAAMTNRVLEAAVCQTGRLPGIDKQFSDQELQAAHDMFKGRIGLKELVLVAAQGNGFHQTGFDINPDTLRAAFGTRGSSRQIHAAGGFSTIDIATTLSNIANKFIMRGWNMVDQTPLRIAKIQNVRDFKTITTVSLADSVRYEQVGNDGEIKHGTLSELTYTNKADTYAKMLAITRTDFINDDVGALTDVPTKLGNGAMKLLNHIFWTEFLGSVPGNFFASGNANINTAVADMTIAGLDATETIFNNQTNPDGTPLGLTAHILLVPTAIKNKSLALMDPQGRVTSGASAGLIDSNVFAGRFRVESSPYISNSSYTGSTSAGYWMLANPEELPVIAIAALNGRVEPTVETADADFNVLGIQMRGYSDVGVNLQEYRGGVYADGGGS